MWLRRSQSAPETNSTQAPSGRKDSWEIFLICKRRESLRRFALEETKKLNSNKDLFRLMLESASLQ